MSVSVSISSCSSEQQEFRKRSKSESKSSLSGRTGGGVLAHGDELIGGERHVALLALLEERVERAVRNKLHDDHDRLARGCDSCISQTVDYE